MKKMILLAMGVAIGSAGTGFGAGAYFDGVNKSAAAYAAASSHDEGHGSKDVGHNEKAEQPHVVNIGRVMIPVQQPKSIKYVIANVGIAVMGEEDASFLQTIEGATKVRNEIITTMVQLAETQILGGPSIDAEKLSKLVKIGISTEFSNVRGVFFDGLSVSEVGRG